MPELFTDPAELAQTRRPLTPEEADKLPHLHRLLLGYYGQPKPRELWDPLTQLIYSLLSARTKTPTSHQVMRDLERTFNAGPGNWDPVRDASVAEIERAIAIVTFPKSKPLSSSKPCKASRNATAPSPSTSSQNIALKRSVRGSSSSPVSAPRPAAQLPTSPPSAAAHSASTATTSA